MGVLATSHSLCLSEFSLLSLETNSRNNEADDIITWQQMIDQICEELCKSMQVAEDEILFSSRRLKGYGQYTVISVRMPLSKALDSWLL